MMALLCVIALLPLCTLFHFLLEQHEWNHGTCRQTGKPWQLLGPRIWVGQAYLDESGQKIIIKNWSSQ